MFKGWIHVVTPRTVSGWLTRLRGVAGLLGALALLLGLASGPYGKAAADLAALDAYYGRARQEWDVPGMAVAIVKDGQVLFEKGYGVRERSRFDPVDEHTLFAIASNTKAFTAAALAMLVDAGKVGWDDPVRRHLPSFELRDPVASADLRVCELLSHRSGLGTFSGDLLWYNTPWSADEVLRRVRYLEPRFPFRAAYGYSNVMFIAAGQVVAAASGVPWAAFLQVRLFEPLGMRETATSVGALAGRTNVATPHGPVATGARAYPWNSWDAAAAAGGVISSAHDMSRWLLLQLGRGTLDGRQYFSEAQSRTMWTPHVSFTVDKESETRSPTTHFRGYGLGWGLRDYQGRLVASHTGAYDGMYSAVSLVPEERLGIVVLTNGMTRLAEVMVSHTIDAFLGVSGREWSREGLERERAHFATRQATEAAVRQVQVPATRPSLALERYAGRYGGNVYGDATVTVENGSLVLRLLANPQLVADLTHLQLDTYVVKWRHEFPWFGSGRAQFVLGSNARITQLKLEVPNEDFWFEELDLRRQEGP
jgi:CubicO group peptidase (beta-lactamase class C family)